MSTVTRNINKKYPIIPKQILTARKGCEYCRQSSKREPKPDNTEMCNFCGFGSEDMILGYLFRVFYKTKISMVLIERIKCDAFSANYNQEVHNPVTGYHKLDDEFFRLMNVTSFAPEVLKGRACFDCRKKSGWLDRECSSQDSKFAQRVFSAIDDDEEDFFKGYPNDQSREFDFYEYRCNMSGLTEVIIPIYTIDKPEVNRSSRGVVGLLLIGQFCVGASPGVPGDEDIYSSGWTKEQTEQIVELRERAWKHSAERAKRHRKDIYSALHDYTEHICDFLEHMRNEINGRETDFLHNYQSRRIKDFLNPADCQIDHKQRAGSIKTRIMALWQKVREDFDLKELHVFIPDLELKAAINNQIIKGEYAGKSDSGLITEIDVRHIPELLLYDNDIKELAENGALSIKRILAGSSEIESLGKERLEEGYYELYSSAYGDGAGKTMFGVFVEWNTLPVNHNYKRADHKDFFRTLVGICSAEVMAFLAKSRAERLSSFTEQTRHDLAHRLQTLDSHNKSFSYNIRKYFEVKSINDLEFEDRAKKYLNANEELFGILAFMKEELDSENIFREPKPIKINAYRDVFRELRQTLQAPWHDRNKGHEIIVSQHEWFTDKLFADKIMFQRIILNLLDNALKYSPPKTNIFIMQNYDRHTKEIFYDIINFGYGIKEDFAKTIFEHGAKGDTAAKGEGLGLYIARQFTSRNNGTLEIVSGVIPKSGEEQDKKRNGLVSDLNITVYNDVLYWKKRRSGIGRLDDLLERLLIKRAALSESGGLLTELSGKIGKPNPLATILVDPYDEIPVDRKEEDPILTPGDLLTYAGNELYQITFRLRLPTIDTEKGGI